MPNAYDTYYSRNNGGLGSEYDDFSGSGGYAAYQGSQELKDYMAGVRARGDVRYQTSAGSGDRGTGGWQGVNATRNQQGEWDLREKFYRDYMDKMYAGTSKATRWSAPAASGVAAPAPPQVSPPPVLGAPGGGGFSGVQPLSAGARPTGGMSAPTWRPSPAPAPPAAASPAPAAPAWQAPGAPGQQLGFTSVKPASRPGVGTRIGMAQQQHQPGFAVRA